MSSDPMSPDQEPIVTVEQPTSQQKRKHGEVALSDQSTWKCIDCSYRNFASANECFKCKTSQEVQLKRKKENPNNWVCPGCKNSNWPHRTICNRCKAVKPGVENQARNGSGMADLDWMCLNCDNNNRAFRVECNKCKLPKSEAINPAIAQFRTNSDWLCMSCGNSNYPYRIACNKCSLPKREAMTAARVVDPDSTEEKSENWLCYNCDNVNLPFRTECNKCKIDKKEGTNPATAFKRSNVDWKCSVCSNVNFHYRVFCNSCQLPKSEIGEEVPASTTEQAPYMYNEAGVPLPSELTGVPTEPIEQAAAAQLYSQHGYTKPAETTTSSYTVLHDLVNNKSDNWSCHNCDNLNYPLRTHCNKCRMSKAEAIAPETRAGRLSVGDAQWHCNECSNQNYHFRLECNKCKGPRPARPIQPNNGYYNSAGVGSDYGYGYGDYGAAGFPIQSYNSHQPISQSQQQSDDPENDWVCNQCNNVNWPKRSKCNKCGLDKSVAMAPNQTGSQSSFDSGHEPAANWVCPECQNVNWPKRLKCNKCGVDRNGAPAVGSAGASTTNWVCNDCLNVNWPHRVKCNKCQVDKPATFDNWACSKCNHVNYSFATECSSCNTAKES